MRTVLLFAYECAPYHHVGSTVGAQRPAQFAKYLPEFGWRAVVLCCDAAQRGKAACGDAAALADARLATVAADESAIIATPSLAYDGALDRAWRWTLGRRGAPFVAARKALTLAKTVTGDHSQPWQPCARVAARAVAARLRVDACIGEHSPDAGLFLARWFAREFGVPWVADFRDPILQPFVPLLRTLYRPVARRLVSSAAHVVNVNPHWAEMDRTLFGKPATSIPNGFDEDEFPEAAPAMARESDRELHVVYSGGVVADQRLEVFLRGLAALRERVGAAEFGAVRFRYRGYSTERVRALAQEAGVADAVDVEGMVPRPQALAALRRADLLLLLSAGGADYPDVHFRRGYYPAKTFEYFGARRPIIVVPGDGAQLDELIARTGTGVSLRTPEAVADYLAAALARRRAGLPLEYRPRTDEVMRYTRRAQAARLAAVLDSVVAESGPTTAAPRAERQGETEAYAGAGTSRAR